MSDQQPEVNSKPPKPYRDRRQGVILALADLLSDNMMLGDEEAALAVGTHKEVVTNLRRSDSFRTLLARAIRAKHGDALHAVEGNRLAATNAALKAVKDIAEGPEVLPTVKLEAAKIALDDWHKSQDRLQPKGVPQHPAANVSVQLTFNELQAARESAVDRGKTIELEPSDATHIPANPFTQQGNLLPAGSQGRVKVREEG